MAVLKRTDPFLKNLRETYPDEKFVKLRELGDKANLRLNFVDETYAVYKSDSEEIAFMVTFVGPDAKIAWGNCRSCIRPVSQCTCRNGFSVSRAVEAIMDRKRAEAAGEEWSIHHPNYAGSFREQRRQSASVDYLEKQKETVPKPTRKLRRVKIENAPAPKKKLRRIKKEVVNTDKVVPKKLRRVRHA